MHLSAQQIMRYHQGGLEPAELLTVADHLGRCAACREDASSSEHVRRAFVSLRTDLQTAADKEPAHLAAEQMAEYVDGQLGELDRSIADNHLELCAECREEFLELRALKTAVRDFSVKERGPIAAPTAWDRIVVFSRSSVRWLPLPAAALAALLVVGLVIIPFRKQVTELTAQVSELQQQNDALQERISSLSEQHDRQPESQAPGLNPLPIVALHDGEAVITLDEDGRLAGLGSAPAPYQDLVKTVLVAQRVKPPLLADLVGKQGVLMGAAAGRDAFSQIGPLAKVVETDRPTFRWSPLSGATSYAVTVYNSTSKQTRSSPRLSGTEWTPPDPLERGDIYAWEVTATKDGKDFTLPMPPSPQSKFKVLEQAKLGELNHARDVYRSSHLILGALYAQYGLLDEAERQFEALVAANPDSLTARKLLDSLRAPRKH